MRIEAQNIVKRYANHTALKDFSVVLESGKITGLLGPNGAGKTSFIRVLNQIIGADEGKILVDGNVLNKSHIPSFGYLPEERGLYSNMKVLTHIVYLARLKGLDKQTASQKAQDWLDKLDLSEWKNAKVRQLSKGMAQKIQFICTVIHDPEIIILDEPFSGFDPINAELIKQEILELKEAGKTIVLSTHNMNSVESICDNIILLNYGNKILDGSIKEVKESHRPNTYHIQFKGNVIGFTNALWAGYELIEREQLGNEHFVATIKLLNDNTINNLLDTVIPHVQIEGVNEVIPSMNDIFIQAIKEDTDG